MKGCQDTVKSLGICFYPKLLSLRSGRIIVLNLAYSHLLFQRHSGLFSQKADDRTITGNNMTYEGINIFVELNHVRNNDLMGFPNKKFIFRYTTPCRITACIHYKHSKHQRIPSRCTIRCISRYTGN